MRLETEARARERSFPIVGPLVGRHLMVLAHTFTHLRPGGLFITDDVLWSGRVLEGGDDGTAATRGVREFTRRLLAHPGFLTAIDPRGDGVAVAVRRAA